MPTTIQWYVRTALFYLLAASVLGVWYQLELWQPVFGVSPYLLVVHTHLALMGGVVQMILGIGLWMFPLTVPLERRLQFKPSLAWLTYGLLNGGLLGRFVVEFLYRGSGESLYGFLTVLTGIAQTLALLIFVYHVWSLRTSRRAAGSAN